MKIYAVFDTRRFYADVHRIREERGVSRWECFEQVGSRTVLNRACESDNAKIDTLAVLAAWAGLKLDDYIQTPERERVPQETRVAVSVGSVRVMTRRRARPTLYDVARFYVDLDRVRVDRGKTWHKVFHEVRSTRVPMTLSAFVRNKIAVNVEAAQALAAWADLDFSAYTTEGL